MPRLWNHHAYQHPGEYGKLSAEGFAVVTHPLLNGQKIYISSKDFVHGLARYYKIPDVCIASMLVTQEFNKVVPEISLSGNKGLEIFRARLKKLHEHTDQKRVLIHCARGRNRSPVAALIYMVDRGIPYDEAYDALMRAMRVRFPEFKLNPYNNYSHSLIKLKQESIARISQTISMPSTLTARP